MKLDSDALDELWACFGFAPEESAGLGLDAALACCAAFNGIAAAEEVIAGRWTEFDVAAHFADLVVEAEMVDTPERQGHCADTFRSAFEITLFDLRNVALGGDKL